MTSHMVKGRSYWSIAVLVIVTVAIAWYLSSHRQALTALGNTSLAAIGCLVALRLLFLGASGLFLRAYASKFGIRLEPIEWFGLSVVTTMGNYIAPFVGGVVARAAYLKRRHALPYAQFATLLASSYLITLWVIGAVGTLALLVFNIVVQFHWQVLAFFVTIVVAVSVPVLLLPFRLPWKNRAAKVVNTSLDGWAIVKSDWALLSKLVAYTLVNILLNAASFWVAYDTLGSPVTFGAALLIGLLGSISILVRITPGNLGIQEAVLSLSSALIGAGADEGLLAALLIRAATLAPVFSLGPFFSLLLTRELATPQTTIEPRLSGKEPPNDDGFP